MSKLLKLLLLLIFSVFCFASCSKYSLGDLFQSRSLSSYPWEKVFVQVRADPDLLESAFNREDSFYISASSTQIPTVDKNIEDKIKSFLWSNHFRVLDNQEAKFHLSFDYDQTETKRQIVFNEAKNSYDLVRYDINLTIRVKTRDGWGNWQDVWVGTATTKLGKNSIDFVDAIHDCWQVDYHLAALLRDFGKTYPDQVKWVYPVHFQDLKYTAEATHDYTLEFPLNSQGKI